MATYLTSEKTRNALINATGELAAKNGFSGVSTRAIARRADENISSIRYHFGSKEKLFEEVVRTVAREQRKRSIAGTLECFAEELDSPQGQSRALKAIVSRFIKLVFYPDTPWWYTRIIYQMLKSKTPLQKVIQEEVIGPDFNALKSLVERAKPDLTNEQVSLYAKAIQGSLIVHTPNIEEGLLGSTQEYSSEYLQQLETVTTRQNQFLLGLPFT